MIMDDAIGVDLDETCSIDPSSSKGIHTIVIPQLGMILSSIGISRGMKRHNPDYKNGGANLTHLWVADSTQAECVGYVSF